MKWTFDNNLPHQTDAISSVLNLFEGIETKKLSFSYDNVRTGNQIITDNWIQILSQNLKKIQKNNCIDSSEIVEQTPIFDIEMETGTGKTYVFLRTILELNKKYGFKKFIILVPSIAIKEGVIKTLEIIKEHFKTLFNISYNFFEYKSENIDNVKEFSQSNNIQIMIINIQSMNKMFTLNAKTLNIMYKEMDKFNGNKPIDLIEKTNPIVIIDEPQSSANTEKSLKAIKRLNPLFILRYSATFRERKNEHLVYRLNSIHAFQKKLVKRITYHEIDSSQSSTNNINSEIIIKNLIKKTIELHLRKQKELLKQNIKVLSLFFIDKVSKYRIYENNTISKGEYANFFEEAFIECANQEEFKEMFVDKDISQLAKKIHNGYFAKDTKTGDWIDQSQVHKIDENQTYKLIMKDKEKILSFDSELSFIFSHSTLREGWDNPNVFQICILHKMGAEIKRRQEIGRGLRLCVNNDGKRIIDDKINELSIIANESYKDFINHFQKELEADGIDFKKIDSDIFLKNSNLFSKEQSMIVFDELKKRNIIDNNNHLNNKFSMDEIENNVYEISELSNNQKREILKILENVKIKTSEIINDGNKQIINQLKNDVVKNDNFQKMLQPILQKTKYKFKFDTNELVNLVIEKINDSINEIQFNTIIEREASLSIKEIGVLVDNYSTNNLIPLTDKQNSKMTRSNFYHFINNIIKATALTKKTIVEVIQKVCNKNENIHKLIFENIIGFQDFLIKKIKESKTEIILKNIEYEVLKENKFSPNDILIENTKIYKNDFLFDLNDDKQKCPYKYIQCDSEKEKEFINDFLASKNIINFLKLPLDFKISTPVGNYTPDWLVLCKINNREIVGVIETKGTDNKNELRYKEKVKIKCAKKHFELLNLNSNKIKIYFNVSDSLTNFLSKIN